MDKKLFLVTGLSAMVIGCNRAAPQESFTGRYENYSVVTGNASGEYKTMMVNTIINGGGLGSANNPQSIFGIGTGPYTYIRMDNYQREDGMWTACTVGKWANAEPERPSVVIAPCSPEQTAYATKMLDAAREAAKTPVQR